MNPAERFAAGEGFPSGADRRKRLGQYFTGTGLGRVLAALAGAGKDISVIDPMSGSGDLLAACKELGATASLMGAMEIDPTAKKACEVRLSEATHVLGSAFDPKSLRKLPRLQWDLVIANPPYVRYQSISKGSGKNFPLPSAVEIRNGLLSEIDLLSGLDATDKALFRKLVQGYSGLADLAVPSWILCAGLVAPGGRLALVVPESWLSRDYAAVVHYMLLRWFEIEFVVEDEHAVWFSDALVKTTLLVAKRVPRKENAFASLDDKSFLHIAVTGAATGPAGACSRLRENNKEPEKSFAKEARRWLKASAVHADDMVKAHPVPLAMVAANLRGVCSKQKWFASMGETPEVAGPVIPHGVERWLARAVSAPRPASLSSLGVNAGQGLRTGANAFFYAETATGGTIVLDKLLPGLKGKVPAGVAVPAIRKQSDLPPGFAVEPATTVGRVLDLRRHALPEDIRSGGKHAKAAYNQMPAFLAGAIKSASLANFGDDDATKRIWDLSAVAPNIRKGRPSDNAPPRFWYMLPDFVRRHKPDVFMARINTGSPKAYLNKDAACVIDANFATLWAEDSGLDPHALLALLNSTWTTACLEQSAAVMGGGALKVEAAHLRRLPVPLMGSASLAKLASLGKRLARAKTLRTESGLLADIDHLVASAALGRAATPGDVKALRGLANAGRLKRQKQTNKKAAK